MPLADKVRNGIVKAGLATALIGATASGAAYSSEAEKKDLRPVADISVSTGYDRGVRERDIITDSAEVEVSNNFPREKQFYVEFDTSRIPEDATIERATLELYKTEQEGVSNLEAFWNSLNDWTEETAPINWTSSSVTEGFDYTKDLNADGPLQPARVTLSLEHMDHSEWVYFDVTNHARHDRDGSLTERIKEQKSDGNGTTFATNQYKWPNTHANMVGPRLVYELTLADGSSVVYEASQK